MYFTDKKPANSLTRIILMLVGSWKSAAGFNWNVKFITIFNDVFKFHKCEWILFFLHLLAGTHSIYLHLTAIIIIKDLS